ncbi:MAG: TonB-dependent receptor [Acidobacteriaceae bacterium]
MNTNSKCSNVWSFLGALGLLLLVTFGLLIQAQAQSDTGRIQGSVTDQQNAAIRGAAITVTNVNTGAVFHATSDGAGNFSVLSLVRGKYKADVTAQGFESQSVTFQLDVSQVQAVNFTLKVGAATTTVEVSSAAPLVNTTTSSTGEVVEGRQLSELPLNGRNFAQLALLTPGVTQGAYGSAASGVGGNAETFRNGETGGAALSVNGLRPQANNFILDGVDNNEGLANGINFYPPVEALAEFRVNTSVAPAEFGRAGGAVIQATTKSGTNSIHGSAFWFIRNSVFDANANYFAPGTAKLPFKRNQFGGTLGLPIIKDKLFIFGDYQGLRQDRPLGLAINTVPTAKMRTGDFSELLGLSTDVTSVPNATYSGCNINAATKVKGAIYDPLTCQQWDYNGQPNVIDPGRLNKAAVNYLNVFPLPNRPSANLQNNYENNQREVRQFNDFDVRMDYNMTSKDMLFVRYSYGQDVFTKTVSVVGTPSGFASGNNVAHPRGITAGYTRILSPNLVNDFRFGYSRPFYGYINPYEGVPFSQNLGIVNANRIPLLGGGALIGGYNSELSYTGDGGPYEVPQSAYQYTDSLSWSHGKHNFKFGANVIQRGVKFFQGNFAKGYFFIGPGTGDFTGYEVSELLAGFVDNYQVSAVTPGGFYDTKSWEMGYFGQDDWKVNNRLILNLGLRYDIYTWPTEAHNLQSNFDIATGTLLRAGVNGNSRSLVDTNYNNFAPRIGFAYDLTGKGEMVVRGGYGIFYYLERGGVGNVLSNNPEFNGTASYSAVNGYRITFTGQAPVNSNDNTQGTAPLPLPVIGNTAFEADPTNSSVISYNKHNPTSMVQQWNLQLETQLDSHTALNIAYVGTKADHMMNTYSYTSPQLGTGLKFFQQQGLGVTVNDNSGAMIYNGLQMSLNRKLSNGLQVTTAYTWSHAIDNSTAPSSPTGGASSIFMDASGPRFDYNRGNSDNDQRQAFTFTALYELPFGRGKQFGQNINRALDYAVGGWQINPFITLGSGTPFYLTVNPQTANSPSNRPDLVGVAHMGTHTRLSNGFIQYFNPAAFAIPPVNSNKIYVRPGTVGRNAYNGPGYKQLNISVFKNFPVTERVQGQFRTEAFNLTNTPQFTSPDANLSDGVGSFGAIKSTRDFSERQVEFALRFTF